MYKKYFQHFNKVKFSLMSIIKCYSLMRGKR
jgi:hypothetical protein